MANPYMAKLYVLGLLKKKLRAPLDLKCVLGESFPTYKLEHHGFNAVVSLPMYRMEDADTKQYDVEIRLRVDDPQVSHVFRAKGDLEVVTSQIATMLHVSYACYVASLDLEAKRALVELTNEDKIAASHMKNTPLA